MTYQTDLTWNLMMDDEDENATNLHITAENEILKNIEVEDRGKSHIHYDHEHADVQWQQV
ncbi:unnamed protein product [Acanthoscelides obtectus]|uniref:Uncharacterized protein n=1 Tax=Acanthoscelides obtectus TaxID=200917 RepID=A0A9P0LN05_ACAOB|nr:unnamed protein product [Acanthoscelides obtectus]CAK1670123.1 hypothetical protein AOBTE_LOCUS27416 [Acanthoscelides obtectus]